MLLLVSKKIILVVTSEFKLEIATTYHIRKIYCESIVQNIVNVTF